MNQQGVKQRTKSGAFFTGASWLQYALLTALLAVSVLFAAKAYVEINSMREAHYEARSQLAYLSNKLRAGDAAGCVAVRDEGGTSVLVLTDRTDSGDYETRFYLYKGALLEEYTASENQLNPEKAQFLGKSTFFHVQLLDGVVTLATDAGTVEIGLRSEDEDGR